MSAINNEQLAAELAEAKLKIKQLEREKRKVGISFSRIPETGSQIEHIIQGDFPYLQPLRYLSYTHEDRVSHHGETALPRTDGNITLIEGENLAVLSTLQLTHKGKIDVIYIDPPYNTGSNDFIYNDARRSSIKDAVNSDGNPLSLDEYETFLDGKARTVGSDDPERHSLWLSFMERRLYLAKELLSDSGVIFVSIDDNEHARLKLLMDAIFGAQNFISNVVWAGGVKNNAHFVSNTNDYFLIYGKNLDHLIGSGARWRLRKTGIDEIKTEADRLYKLHFGDNVKATRELKKWFNSLPSEHHSKSEKSNSLYLNIDETGRLYKVAWPDAPKNGPRYELLHPNGKPVRIPASGWRFTPTRMNDMIQSGDIVFLEDDTKLPILKRYLDDTSMKVLPNFFTEDRRTANVNLQKIIGRGEFDFPKDENVLKKWIRYISQNKNDIMVLDFFAGSGTTAHAVAELNSEDGGNRQCILVTHGDENGKNIAEDVTATRLKRVLSGKEWADGKEHPQLPGELTYMKLMFAPKHSNPSSAVELMQSKFSGLASLEQDATIREYGDYYITLANSKKLVVLLTNQDYLYEEYETVVDFLNDLKDKTDYNEYVVYIPTSETYDEFELQLEDWHKIPYPSDYLRKHSELIDYMKGRKLLIPSTTVDSEDEEISEESK